MQTFQVGKLAPEPFWPASVTDGGRFEQGKEGDWFIIMYMTQPSKEERKVVRKAKILSRYLIDDTGAMVLALIRFKGSALIFELVHDPTKYQAIEWGQRVEMWERTNMVTCLLIDSATGILWAIRYTNMPAILWGVWKDSWRKAFSIEWYTEKYDAWIGGLWKHMTQDLWEMGTPAGSFGEEYPI